MKKMDSLIMNEFYTYTLIEVYKMSDEEYANLSDEKLKKYFCTQQICFRHKYSKISAIITFKGNLRISWSFDIKYNKNIDLIFFPEENPYINYSVLYAKDFSKTIDEEYYGLLDSRNLSNINIPYNINYDFVKDVLSKSNFSESQQKRFFDSRFGSVLVPMEIEFEWYAIDFETSFLYDKKISFYKYDTFMGFFGYHKYRDAGRLVVLIGVIKNYYLLNEIVSNLEAYNIMWLKNNTKSEARVSITKPLPTSALAVTKTNLNDFIVNLRDKPDSKNGKMVAQLFSQRTKTPNIYIADSNGLGNGSIKPIYKPMIEKGRELYHKENPDLSVSLDLDSCYMLYYSNKMAQKYYQSNKSKLINPLWRDGYLVLIWDILPNNWCKVWVLKAPNFDIEFFDMDLKDDDNRIILNEDYKQTYLNSPSKLKLYEGYIHSSGLEYLEPFGDNYIKR